ncbi:hypothetical protein F4804DRAFT_342147 [Jackrogersella minutella]|nr:hypothetical protein F4804DRAFT_342147 [Jackrogersella minutella]
MSYQYPPPQEVPELGVSQAGYTGSHTTSTLESHQILPIRRRGSLSQEHKLKRSVSTPNVRSQGTNEVDSGPLGLSNEKRRNRLGYHRTPIACKHCRQRKIRCKQPEIPDVLARCESCIHLKIDCIYTPVNQPSPPTPVQRRGTRASVGTGFASPSTSPSMSMGHTVERQSNPPYHQLATMPSMPNMGQQSMEPGEDETYSAEPKIVPNTSSGRTFNYGHGTSSWVPTDAGSSVAKTTGDTNTAWSNYPHGLPETPDLSYASHTPTPVATHWQTHSPGLSRIDTSAPLDDPWRSYPPGTRSMSYSDDQSGHFASPARLYGRVHPATSAVPETGLGVQGSLSAGAVPQPTYGGWQQPYPYSRSHAGYEGPWYEDRQHHGSEGHISLAEDPSPTGGLYYSER